MSFIETFISLFIHHWILICGLYPIVLIIEHKQTKNLMKKFNASPPANYINNGPFGIKELIIGLKHHFNNTSIDYAIDQFNHVEFPYIHTFVTNILGNDLIMTKDPENIKAIISTDFDKFDYGSRSNAVEPSLGMGIFTLEGENWKVTRKVLHCMFDRTTISKVDNFEPHFKRLVNRIDGKVGYFDIQNEFLQLGLELSTEFLFGKAVEEDTPYLKQFNEAWDRCQNYMFLRLLLGKYCWLINDWRYKQCNQVVHSFCDNLVTNSFGKEYTNDNSNSTDKFVFVHELAKYTNNKKFIRDQSLSMIMASRDTISELLAFTMMELARNPVIWERFREQVDSKFGMESTELITFDSLRQFNYVQAILNETLRMYPGVPRNMKTAKCTTTLPRGGGKEGNDPILVKKGQSVGFISIATQLDPVYFGVDAHIYNPERWFEPRTKNLGFKYLPFNGGPRSCLGQQFSLIEASYILVRFAQTYERIESRPGSVYPPKKKALVNMCAVDGVYVRFHK